MSVVSVANAGTATSTLTLNGTVASSCTTSVSIGTLSFTFVPGATPSGQFTSLDFSCSVDSTITSLTATSANGWQFTGATHGAHIPYTMVVNGGPAGINPTPFNSTWSGTTGSTSAVTETTGAFSVPSITGGTFSQSLQVQVSAISSTAPVDTYSDTVTFTTTF